MNAFPSPEVMPAADETRPVIGPNLAGNVELCRRVAAHLVKDFGYPYVLQQMRLWDVWDRIDDAWRVRGKAIDMDMTQTDPAVMAKTVDAKAAGVVDRHDGVSARVYPAAFHRQVRNKTDMHMSIAWADGPPVRARKPKNSFENPLYNPEQQQVMATQSALEQCISQVQMKRRDRLVRGSWSKYGHAWVMSDFKYRFIEKPETIPLPPDPMAAIQFVQLMSAQMGGQQPQFGQDQFGRQTATWTRLIVDPDSMVTDFQPIRHDAVFVDQTLSAEDMDRQPCPWLRSHVTRFDLWGNDYEPMKNPFGWLNVRMALDERLTHYTLSDQDELVFTAELRKKNGLTDAGQIKPRNTLKQLWTCYPMLAIDPATGALDEGDGIECPTCRGAKEVSAEMVVGGQTPQSYSTLAEGPNFGPPAMLGAMDPAPATIIQTRQPCPQCQGIGRVFIEPKRYVVQMFGAMATGSGSNVTVLRIQPNPTVKNRVPLLFGAHLTEDTAGAIPLAVAEAALKSNDQLGTAYNHVYNFTNRIINPPGFYNSDEPHAKMDWNAPNARIPYEGKPPEMWQQPSFDANATLTNMFIPMQQSEVQDIIGIPPTLLGMVSSGRRAATEIQTASDAAKLPITVEIDSCNTQIHGRWAQLHIDNIEAYGDRDWIQKKTGRTTFGRVELHTEVAADYFTKMSQMQLLQNSIPAFAGIPGFNAAKAAAKVFKLAGFEDADDLFDDGGLAKSQMDGFRIIAQILGEGQPVPPAQDDPHELYVGMFSQALKDPYWQEKAPQNLPILQWRLQVQQQLLIEQQMQQMQAAMMEQQLLNPPQQGGGGRANPSKPNRIPETPTQARQAQSGREAPQ